MQNSAEHRWNSRPALNRRFICLFLGSFLIYLAFSPPGIYSVDGFSMLLVADSLVTHHDFNVPAGAGYQGKDGRSYSPWYPLQSVLAVPVVAVAVKVSAAFHLPIHYVESLFVTVLPALYTALTIPLVYALALRLGSDDLGGLLAAVVYGFGTMALVYTRDFYAEPLLALLIAAAILLVFRSPVSWSIVPVAGLAMLAKPTGIVVGPILSAYLFWKTRRLAASSLPALGTAIGFAIYALYNYYRFGNYLRFGHQFAFSAGYFPEGFPGLILSPGVGLIWYCPCVLLCVAALRKPESRTLEVAAISAMFLAFLFLHSFWFGWSGGASWGPRLMLPVLPGLVAMTGLLKDKWRKAVAGLGVLGFLLSAPNLFSTYHRYYAESGERGIGIRQLWWEPTRSLLLNAWPVALRQVNDARQVDVRQLMAQGNRGPATKISDSTALRVVSIWWWALPVVHVSRIWGVLLSLLFTAAGAWMLVRVFTVSDSASPEEPHLLVAS